MNYWEESLYGKNISPFLQGAIVLGLILIFMLISLLLFTFDMPLVKKGAPWTIFATFMLFYALVNSVLSISATSRNKYWMHSILAYIVIGIVGGSLAYLISGLSIDEAGSYKWILFIFTFCYLLFLSIVRAMKKIVTIAQKQDKRLRGEE
jgi:hypothetical protein